QLEEAPEGEVPSSATGALWDALPGPEEKVAEGPTIEVRVLGPVRIEGVDDAAFPVQHCRELVAYLAFHRRGVEADSLMEALWPGGAPNPNRLQKLVSRTRAACGSTAQGEPYLPRVGADKLYRIQAAVGTDLERFTTLVGEASSLPPDEAIPLLRAALDVVEGPPFTNLVTGWHWAFAEGIVAHAQVAVDEATTTLARLCLDQGDADGVRWAARKGLLATPGGEIHYRHLLQAAAAADNALEFEAIWRDLIRVVEADDGPGAYQWLEEETIALYERHSRRRLSATG
ncbi:MAG: AfsR/SARP family transcriptional regulator, partial [Acidimicrobiia bacterium]